MKMIISSMDMHIMNIVYGLLPVDRLTRIIVLPRLHLQKRSEHLPLAVASGNDDVHVARIWLQTGAIQLQRNSQGNI